MAGSRTGVPQLQRLNYNRGGGPPILVKNTRVAGELPTGPPIAYTLDALVANITFAGGSHSLVVKRVLSAAVANVTFLGGAHTLAASHKLLAAPANITVLGGAHALKTGRRLDALVANITFLGGDHVLTYTPGHVAVVMNALPGNITFSGGAHELTYTNNAPVPTQELYYRNTATGVGFRHTGPHH